jgi:hypothetical protein
VEPAKKFLSEGVQMIFWAEPSMTKMQMKSRAARWIPIKVKQQSPF